MHYLTGLEHNSKKYMNILEDLLAENEITQKEYNELKEEYEYNVKRYAVE